MKKNTIILFTLLSSVFAFSQVGINTPDPKATFDITAKEATGTSRNVEGLLIPRVDRERAQSMFEVPVSTLVYVNDISTGLQMGTAINIDDIGYYYFDGSFWVKLNTPSIVNPMVNIYNTDGTLESDCIVNQEDKTIAFTGTRVNSFSIDGNTFSVDAANKRVGIGTTTPNNRLDLGTANGAADITSPLGKKLALFNNAAGTDFYGLGINTGFLQFHASSTPTEAPGMVLSNSGNVGIGNTAPNANAVLELTATNRGFLPPRLTTAQRNAIPAATKPAGLMIYNTTTNCMDFWNSSAWVSTCAAAVPPAGAITAVTCASATNNGTLTRGINNSVTSSIPYTGGNGGSHGGQTIASTGVTGLTATLAAGSFATGNGALTYTITGTPSAVGNANFAINIGGRTCTLTRAIIAPVGSVTTLNCAGATPNGTLTSRVAASGVSSVVPYTGGNGGTYAAQSVASTGVAGLTATLAAGTLASGNGTLTYTITGTPASAGTASFNININGRACVITRTVTGAATPPSGATACTASSFRIPYAATSGTVVSGTINGVPVNATVTYTNIVNNNTAICGSPLGGGYQMRPNAPSGSSVRIRFDKKISNLKIGVLFPANMGNTAFTEYFRNNNTVVNPTNTSLGSTSCSTLRNYGAVWFDEVEIRFTNLNATAGQIFSFCVGDVQ